MRLNNIKDCSTCEHSLVLGDTVDCNSDNFRDKQFFKKNGRYCAGNCQSYKKCNGSIQSGRIEQKDAISFILAGKAEFVLHSTKTNEDFKFVLTRKESINNKEEYIYFVNVMLSREKIYAGHIKFDNDKQEFYFMQGIKGKMPASDRTIRSLLLVINKLFKYEIVNNLEIFHMGKCGACGKKLTTPESILTGLGPTCCKNLGIPRKKIN